MDNSPKNILLHEQKIFQMEPHTLSFNPFTGDSSSVVNPGTVEIVFVLVVAVVDMNSKTQKRLDMRKRKKANGDKLPRLGTEMPELESQFSAIGVHENILLVFYFFVWLKKWGEFMQQYTWTIWLC